MAMNGIFGGWFDPAEQKIARRALEAYEEIRSQGGPPAQFDSVALGAIKDIQTQAENPTAAALARTTETAYQRLSPQPNSASPCADVLRSCLQVVAAPIGAPLGIALAKVGSAALSESDIGITAAAACTIGLTFTHAINDLTVDQDERNHAQSTLSQYQATQPMPDSAPQCANILKGFLVADAQRG
ncbi:MAG TPA: hypothetical protein VGO93_18525 [Candidatus Xenobia bacterium]|jgi:hypothetical protein